MIITRHDFFQRNYRFYVLHLKGNVYSLTPKLFLFGGYCIQLSRFCNFLEWKGNALMPPGDSPTLRGQSTFPKSINGKTLCFNVLRYRHICVNPFKFHRNV